MSHEFERFLPKWPVITALFLFPAAEQDHRQRPHLKYFEIFQLSAATFEIKLPSESRTIAYAAVIEFPAVIDCGRTTYNFLYHSQVFQSEYLRKIPGNDKTVAYSYFQFPDVCVAVIVNVPVLTIVTGREEYIPLTTWRSYSRRPLPNTFSRP